MKLTEFVGQMAENKGKGAEEFVIKAIRVMCHELRVCEQRDGKYDDVGEVVISREFADFCIREIYANSENVFDYNALDDEDIETLQKFVKGEYDDVLGEIGKYNGNPEFMNNMKMVAEFNEFEEEIDDEGNTDSVEDILGEYEEDDEDDEIEDKEEEEKNEGSENKEDKEAEEIDTIEKWHTTIDTSVKGVMEIYKDMYASGYELEKPFGVLTGVGYIDGFISSKEDMVLASFMNEITRIMGIRLVASDKTSVSIADINNGVNYLPKLQAEIAMGVKNGEHVKYWDEYSEYMEQRVRGIYESIYRSNPGLTIAEANAINNRVQNILTNSILITEFDVKSSAKFRIKFDKQFIDRVNKGVLENALNNGMFSKYGKVSMVSNTGRCKKVNIVFDETIDGAKPMFAYKVYEYYKEKGIKPDWSRVIIGKNLKNDEIYTMDLASNMNFNTFIGAGPRSGKGVMTLNILASAMCLGMPVFYADCKPEMSKCVKQLADKYNSAYMSIDGNSGIETDLRLGKGIPSELPIARQLGGYIAYCKLMQLMTLIAEMRAAGIEIKAIGRNDRMLFILDETKAMLDIVNSMDSTIKSVLTKDSPYSEEVKNYLTKVINWGNSVSGTVASSLVSSLPKSRINLITLAQKLNMGDWDDTNLKIKVPFSGMVKSPTINKLVGNGSSGTTMGFKSSAPNSELANTYINSTYRCFGNYGSVRALDDNEAMTVFKPYLVLPSVDVDTPLGNESFGELERNYKKLGDVKDLHNEDGTPIEGIALEGIIKTVDESGELVRKSLGQAYEIAYEVLSRAGLLSKYSDVAESRKVLAYMYDGSAETLKSVGEIMNEFESRESGEERGVGFEILDEKWENENEQNVNKNLNVHEGKIVGTKGEADDEPEEIINSFDSDDVDYSNYISENDSNKSTKKSRVQSEKIGYENDGTESKNFDTENELLKKNLENREENEDSNKRFTGGYTGVFPNIGDSKDGDTDGVKQERIRSDRYIGPSSSNIKVMNEMNKYFAEKSGDISIIANNTTRLLCRELICNDATGIPRSMIRRIEIYEDAMFVNGKELVLNNIVPYNYGLELADVIDYEYLLKYFKSLKTLSISKGLVCDLCEGVGIDKLSDILDVYKNLSTVKVTESGKTVVTFDRSTMLMRNKDDAEKAEKIRKVDKYAKAKSSAKKKSRNKKFMRHALTTGQKIGYGLMYAGTNVITKVKDLINSFKE